MSENRTIEIDFSWRDWQCIFVAAITGGQATDHRLTEDDAKQAIKHAELLTDFLAKGVPEKEKV